nr:helix-turn-helix domain-containing protein [Bacillus subtilis]
MSDKAKALPFDTAAGYTGIPNVILTHYQYFPKLNGNAVLVYAFLLKFYNADYGYAFPTQEQAARALAVSDSTYRNAVKTLVQARADTNGRERRWREEPRILFPKADRRRSRVFSYVSGGSPRINGSRTRYGRI